jgi:hypothetical protein
MSFDEMSFDKMSFGKMSFDEMSFAEMSFKRSNEKPLKNVDTPIKKWKEWKKERHVIQQIS